MEKEINSFIDQFRMARNVLERNMIDYSQCFMRKIEIKR